MSLFDHHAYMLHGGQSAVSPLIAMLKKEGVVTSGNPDFSVVHYDSLGIEEARAIRVADVRNPIGDKKIFIISYDSITKEAENALLKTFEEPSGHSFYFLAVKKSDEILPTLRSRLQTLELETERQKEVPVSEALDYLKMTLDERMVFSHELSEDIKKDKKSKNDALDFLNQLERVLSTKKNEVAPEKLKNFLDLRSYAEIKGSSIKNILDAISIILPEIK